jgi:hypothetical protein
LMPISIAEPRRRKFGTGRFNWPERTGVRFSEVR